WWPERARARLTPALLLEPWIVKLLMVVLSAVTRKADVLDAPLTTEGCNGLSREVRNGSRQLKKSKAGRLAGCRNGSRNGSRDGGRKGGSGGAGRKPPFSVRLALPIVTAL